MVYNEYSCILIYVIPCPFDNSVKSIHGAFPILINKTYTYECH